MSEAYPNCQSCGMPRKRDEQGVGTNADGTKSTLYCSHCFADGRFTQPHLTADEMQALVKGKLREFGIPGFLCWPFTNKIPKLKRWNSGASG